MGIFSRLLRLFKADLHGVMDQMEDRDLLLKQYLREMETALAVKKAQLERLEARRSQADRELAIYRDKVSTMEDDIALAVARKKDDIARMLIRKQYPLHQGAEALDACLKGLIEEIETAQASYAQQVAQYEQVRQRAAAVADRNRGPEAERRPDPFGRRCFQSEPSDEEVELALLQRKESRPTGRLS